MSTNPLSFKFPPAIGGGDITCTSNSANAQTVIVIFENNNSIVFTGSGIGTALKTSGGSTHGTIPVSLNATTFTPATIIFFSHQPNSRIPMALSKVKEPVITPRPWGHSVNITSQDASANDECIMSVHLNG